jgi:DNA-binding transcriptional ArsR family regulator
MPLQRSTLLFSESDANAPGELRRDASEFNVVFIHSLLDDYGLPAAAFRVYCHLARRDGRDGAWSAVKGIAHVCRLHPQTVRKALRLLTTHRLVSRELRCGQTTIYRLTPASAWRPPTRIDSNQPETDTPPSILQGSPANKIEGTPYETDTAKGNPSEDNPVKEIQTPPQSPKGDCVKDTGSTSSTEEELYAAYPRKVGRPVALRAIRRALAKYPFDFLVERTRLYAQTCNSPAEFIPHPSTWFNQERFNDDPVTWRRTVGASGKPQPAIIRPDKFGCGVSKL